MTETHVKSQALRERSKLIPGYLVRYADDFVIITDSREHANSWKVRIQEFLRTEMKLTLSPEKTLITDVRKQYIHFLGYEYKVVKGKAKKGYITRTIPDRKRLRRKVDAIALETKQIPTNTSREQLISEINHINSAIRGLVNYYENCTWVNVAMKKYARRLQSTAMRRFKQYKGEWIPAKDTQNLPRVHENYRQKIPSIRYRDMYIGMTALNFCKWEKQLMKNADETPFTEIGRDIHFQRTKKKRQNDRLDDMYNPHTEAIIRQNKWDKHYNFEFYMNRAYALNRDKLKCKVCGGWLISCTPYTHRINPYLPQNKVNKVSNLVSVHKECLEAINNPYADITRFEAKTRRKIESFREKLVHSHAKTTA